MGAWTPKSQQPKPDPEKTAKAENVGRGYIERSNADGSHSREYVDWGSAPAPARTDLVLLRLQCLQVAREAGAQPWELVDRARELYAFCIGGSAKADCE